jgi:RNA polymerase sigma-70 factor, ECF subfamily
MWPMPTPVETTDPLLPAVAAGDRRAMEACLERYEGLVWALARRMLGASAEAEDTVQEIFIDLWKSAGRFDVRAGSEPTFVGMIARRRLIDARRRRARRPEPTPIDELTTEPMAETAAPSRLDDEALRALAVLRELPSEQRRLLEWSLADGLSHSEIAEKTGTPLGTVKSLIRRGLVRVREALEVRP